MLPLRHEDRSFPGREAWGPVGGRSRGCCSWWQEGVEVFFSRVCMIRSLFCLENPFMSRLFVPVSVIVFPYGWDTISFIPGMYHSVIPYVYVDSSNRSLSGVLLHSYHDNRSSSGRKAWGPVGRRRACCLWWQEGVEVFFSRVCKIWSLLCLKNPFMS